MTRQLCSVCHAISPNFWALAYDLFESRRYIKAKLQSYNDIQRQSKIGCHYCTLLVSSIWLKKLKSYDDCLYMRRDYGDPHKAFCLGTQDFPESLGKLYFFRIPEAWCK
jgi:hypothetical protein